MSIKSIKFIEDSSLYYKWEIELSNGVVGKNIMYNDECMNYIITRDCEIYTINTEKMIYKRDLTRITKGYPKVNLVSNDGKIITRTIHRMYALAYVPNPDNKPIVNHKNGKKYDNDLTNLEWSTYSENNKHAFDMGLKLPSCVKSENCNLTKHTKEEAEIVCKLLEDGYSPSYIYKTYPNLHKHFVINIKNKHTWKELSKDKNFSNTFVKNTFFTKDDTETMIMLFKEGLSVTEVIRAMNWEYTELLRGRVRGIKKLVTGPR